MKAMIYILIVIGLVSILTAKADVWSKQPEANMNSTSTMHLSGTTLPQAAVTGAYTTYNEQEASQELGVNPQKRARPGDWAEPGLPLGDAVLPMLLLAAGYAVYVARRKRVAAER